MSKRIFISYRREDSRGSAGRLYDQLAAYFGRDRIFMDVDTIQPGLDFVDAIEVAVRETDVLIVVIGSAWLNALDASGNRRLDNPEDFVRLEIATALNQNIRVIPVLVEGAMMPRSTDLPDDLKPLARRNAIEISHTRFHSDTQRLIQALELTLEQIEADRIRKVKRSNAEKLAAEKIETDRLAGERAEVERVAAQGAEIAAAPVQKGKPAWRIPAWIWIIVGMILIVSIVIGIVPQLSGVFAPIVGDLSNIYDVHGTNPDNSTYQGSVTISKSGTDTYVLIWDISGITWHGNGTLSGSKFVVDDEMFTNTYTVNSDGSLEGNWTQIGEPDYCPIPTVSAPPPEPVLPERPPEPADQSDTVAMADFFTALQKWQDDVTIIQEEYKAEIENYQATAEAYKATVVVITDNCKPKGISGSTNISGTELLVPPR